MRLATYNACSLFPDDGSDDLIERFVQLPAREIIERLSDSGIECLLAPGGLRLHDSVTGAIVTPGCCCGLETWREWLGLCTREGFPWLGHDPEPWIEVVEGEASDELLRIWDSSPGKGRVDILRSELPALLEGVHRDLIGFLEALEVWTTHTVGQERAPALTAAFDRHFHITPALR